MKKKKTLTRITRSIRISVKEILRGNLIAIPTETVYGLGANAIDENAVLKIYEVKKRPLFDPLIVHIKNIKEIKKYVDDIPNEVYKLAEKFSPGPITYILKKNEKIPDIVTSGLDTVALRIPSHPLFQKILKKCGVPIAAPSANMFGKISPTSAEDVYKELKGKVNYILDGGQCEFGIESTVVSFIDDEIRILRPGFITKRDIEKVLRKKVILSRDKTRKGKSKNDLYSPGMLKNHYSPDTPLYITDNINDFIDQKRVGLIDLSGFEDLNEVAINLFAELRRFDEKGFDYLVIEKVKNKGLGVAINDRLEKASKGKVKMAKWEIKFSVKK